MKSTLTVTCDFVALIFGDQHTYRVGDVVEVGYLNDDTMFISHGGGNLFPMSIIHASNHFDPKAIFILTLRHENDIL